MAYQLCSISLESDCTLKVLHLVDPDIFEVKNFPYLHSKGNDDWVDMPKCMVLKNLVKHINIDLDIKTICRSYPFSDAIEFLSRNSFIVDCRDTADEDSTTSMKLNLDGEFGLINIDPKKFEGKHNSRYRFGNSMFYASSLANLACRLIYFESSKLSGYRKFHVILNCFNGEEIYHYE